MARSPSELSASAIRHGVTSPCHAVRLACRGLGVLRRPVADTWNLKEGRPPGSVELTVSRPHRSKVPVHHVVPIGRFMEAACWADAWRPAVCSHCDGAERVPADRMPTGQEDSEPRERRASEHIEPTQTNIQRHEFGTRTDLPERRSS